MTTYVLVHGGDRDGSVWDEVSLMLKDKGHNVLCPTMTSVSNASLETNINEVVRFIKESNIDNFILVGHSYGGMVITGVAHTLSDHIDALIYVDSIIPRSGQSLFDTAQEYGFDLVKNGLTKDPAVISKCIFDSKKVYSKPKIYVYCLQSEFLSLTKMVYEEVQKSKDWVSICVDAKHGCMLTHPKELAVIFLGAEVIV